MLLPQSLSGKRGSSIQLVLLRPPRLPSVSRAKRERETEVVVVVVEEASPPHFARLQSVLRRTPRASPPERHGRRLSVMSPPQSPSLTARFLRGEDSIVLASCSSPEPISASRGCSIGFEAERGQAPAELVAELGRAQQMYLRGSALLFSFSLPLLFLGLPFPLPSLSPKRHTPSSASFHGLLLFYGKAHVPPFCVFSPGGAQELPNRNIHQHDNKGWGGRVCWQLGGGRAFPHLREQNSNKREE